MYKKSNTDFFRRCNVSSTDEVVVEESAMVVSVFVDICSVSVVPLVVDG